MINYIPQKTSMFYTNCVLKLPLQIYLSFHYRTVTFLANNLTVLEILQQFNKHISSTVKVEEKISTNVASVTAKKKKSKK